MLAFNGRLQNLKFDADSFRKKLDDACKTQIKQAARAWLRAVILRVPVYTGMARGSLLPLGAYLRVAVPITPEAPPRHDRNVELGKQESEFKFTKANGVYIFHWNTDVAHYLINEYNDMSGILPLRNPTPWKSLEAGEEAFMKSMREFLSSGRVPNMADFVYESEQKVR